MASNPSAFTAAQPVPFLPADNAMLATSEDPLAYRDSQILTAGTVYLVKIPVRAGILASNVLWFSTAAGVGASTGSFSGLYSPAGALLSGSADIGALLLSPNTITVPLTTPQTLPAGFVWAAIVANLATTLPTFTRLATAGGQTNVGLAAAAFRVAVNGTGQTTLPASITPSANTAAGSFALWAGVS